MKQILAGTIFLFLCSCKTKQAINQIPNSAASTELSTEKIIQNHYQNKLKFTTIAITSEVNYTDERQSQNVSAEIKIKKDQALLIVIRFLGITMAKAYITPQSVQYYEKIKGTYFEGNFEFLSNWLGSPLDFNTLQNMLVGEALYNLKPNKYNSTLQNQYYQLTDASDPNLNKSFFLDAATFSLIKQLISQTATSRNLQIEYADYKNVPQGSMPSNVLIQAFQPNGKTEIGLKYNKISFDEEFSMPYAVPDGYKKIIIK